MAETLKEQIDGLLTPLFAQNAVDLPPERVPWDYVDELVINDPENLVLLTTIFQSIHDLGAESPAPILSKLRISRLCPTAH